MGHVTAATIARSRHLDKVTDAIKFYDEEDRIHVAQYDMEFEDGIKVANDVTAEFLADLHHVLDYHGQDWSDLIAVAEAKYQEQIRAAEAETVAS